MFSIISKNAIISAKQNSIKKHLCDRVQSKNEKYAKVVDGNLKRQKANANLLNTQIKSLTRLELPKLMKAFNIQRIVLEKSSKEISKSGEKQPNNNEDAFSKSETTQTEYGSHKRETKFKFGIFEGPIRISLENTTHTNFKFFPYDLWKWFVDFVNSFYRQNKIKETEINVKKLQNQLEDVRQAKVNIEIELEKLSTQISKLSMEKTIARSVEVDSITTLLFETKEKHLKDLERKLSNELKVINTREQELFQRRLYAIKNSKGKENLGTKLLNSGLEMKNKKKTNN